MSKYTECEVCTMAHVTKYGCGWCRDVRHARTSDVLVKVTYAAAITFGLAVLGVILWR